jgi:hypothetical protein
MKKAVTLFLILFYLSHLNAQEYSPDDIRKYNNILMQEPGDGNLKFAAYNQLNNCYILNGVNLLGPAYEALLKYCHPQSLLGKYNFTNILAALSKSVACSEDIFNYLDNNSFNKYPSATAFVEIYIKNFVAQSDTNRFNQLDMMAHMMNMQTVAVGGNDLDDVFGTYLSKYGTAISQDNLDWYLEYLLQNHRNPARGWTYMQTKAGLYFYLKYFQQRDNFMPDGWQLYQYPVQLLLNQAVDMTAADWLDYDTQILREVENRIGNNSIGPIDAAHIVSCLKFIKPAAATYITALAKTPGLTGPGINEINICLNYLNSQ